MTHELIISKNAVSVKELVNRSNAMTANNFEHISQKNKDGSPVRVRRNGKTQTWKKQPDNFRIPIKYGLYGYGNLTQDNAHEFVIA